MLHYEHYLDLLDDEADSQDTELAARLAQASSQPTVANASLSVITCTSAG
jgi:hypothetical protein